MGTNRTIEALLAALRPDHSPGLIWYGPDAERVELSGRVLDNWVAKTANLLVEELDAGPGTVVQLDMAPHWRGIVWALATWQTGATLGLGTAAADVVVTSDPGRLAGAQPPAQLVAVAPGALQLRWEGELPPGVLDYAAEVRAFADFFADPVVPDPDAPALEHPGGTISFGALLPQEAAAGTSGGQVRRHLLLPARAGWPAVLAESLATWQVAGTVVLVHPQVAVTQRLLESERINAQLQEPS
ncbi:TIGR03089 family protein [Arthrobacter mobilis]|uniref:TIGR03089 family protein n=1 Tax=Arthrobacter mobilis TaxID=2724944 RepID=A0A7X6K2K0_9MICC|nr:TIGR03089 family protein [Arthrobacter mobilis]NKX53272.1 TIGR03089 family protein [Arthrobacter mobilis]